MWNTNAKQSTHEKNAFLKAENLAMIFPLEIWEGRSHSLS